MRTEVKQRVGTTRSLQLVQGLSSTLILRRVEVIQFVDPLFGKRLPSTERSSVGSPGRPLMAFALSPTHRESE